jgi:hypothetical protein
VPGGRDLSVLVKRSLALRTRRATSAHANASHVTARLREDYVAKDEASAYRGRRDEAVVEGEAEGLGGRGGPMAAADPRDAAGYFLNGAPVRLYPR